MFKYGGSFLELTLKKRTNEAADARRQPEERIRTKAGSQMRRSKERKTAWKGMSDHVDFVGTSVLGLLISSPSLILFTSPTGSGMGRGGFRKTPPSFRHSHCPIQPPPLKSSHGAIFLL